MTESQHFQDVRASYDTLAVDYGAMYGPTMVEPPIDQLMLKTFAEIVLAGPGGRVLDIGSGPGRISHNLDALGVDVFGLDLSPGMVAVARAAYPGLSFDVGSMLALDLPDAGLAGIVAWWSIIHTPPEMLPTVFAEFERTLAPAGSLLVGFHMGDGLRHIAHAYGHDLSMDMWMHPPEQIVRLATDAGLVAYAQLLREPQGREKSVQAMMLFTKPDPAQAETAPPASG
jgi:SAM-dependent methyltransferase